MPTIKLFTSNSPYPPILLPPNFNEYFLNNWKWTDYLVSEHIAETSNRNSNLLQKSNISFERYIEKVSIFKCNALIYTVIIPNPHLTI